MAGNFDPKTFSVTPHQLRVEKPWGYEIIYSPSDAPTTGKILFVKAGFRWSLQWHDEKVETICLFQGKATLVLENEKNELQEIDMELQKGYFVHKGQTHRLISVEDCMIVESSTPETGNTVRIQDDFKRDTETEAMRAQENRGWKSSS